MTADSPLPRQTRAFIVLVALLQGGLLYLAQLGAERHLWPFAELGGRVCWYTLVMTVPSMLLLSVQQLRDRRLWQHVAAVGVLFAALAAWAAWSATGAPGLSSGKVLGPFGVTVAMGLFVALPWLQHRQAQGRWRAAYRELFEHAWQNALTLALALLFVGVCWAVLTLWASLFALVKIMLFRELFREDAFIYLATGIMVGLGILIGRTQHRAVQVLRQILFAICTGLLPLLACIALLFLLMLPFTGLQALWQTRSAAAILLSVVFLLVGFANAVYQDGAALPPYPRWLRRIVEAGLLSLPLYAGLAAYAMGLRIAQYGWTGDRFWGALLAALALAYALGYALAVLRAWRAAPKRWLPHLAGSNKALSWALVALAVLVNTPLLDPYRIVVNSQMQRLADGAVAADEADLEFLRFDNGRRGYRALQSLRRDPAFAGDAQRARRLDRALALTSRFGDQRTEEELRRSRLRDPARIRAQVPLAGGHPAPAADWWAALAGGTLDDDRCLQLDSECVASGDDLDADGQPDVLLCDVGQRYGVHCRLYARDAKGWYVAATTSALPSSDHRQEELREAVRNGRWQPRRPRWPNLQLPGVLMKVDPAYSDRNPSGQP